MQAVPETQMQLKAMPIEPRLGEYDPIVYTIPLANQDFIIYRGEFKESADNVSTSRPVGQQSRLTFRIPAQQRSMIPKDTFFKFQVRVTFPSGATDEQKASIRLENSIQSMIQRMTIRDGSANKLEEIHDYNVCAEIVRTTHIPKRIQYSKLQEENVYEEYNKTGQANPCDRNFLTPIEGCWTIDVDATADAANCLVTTDSVGNALADLRPGDYVFIASQGSDTAGSGANALFPFAEVLRIVDDNSLILGQIDTNNTNITACTLFRVGRSALTLTQYGERDNALKTTDGADYTFQPYGTGFFNSQKHWPLWASNGLQIEFLLADSKIPIIDYNSTADVSTDTRTANPLAGVEIEVVGAEVYYKAVNYAPVPQSALEAKFIRDGLNWVMPTFRTTKRIIPGSASATVVTEEFQESFAMLKTIYVVFRNNSTTNGYTLAQNDSFSFENPVIDRYVVDYNRVKLPNWGDETGLTQSVLYTNQQQGLNLLGDYNATDLASFEGFSRKGEQIFITNFERFPEGSLSGVDTQTGRIKIRFQKNFSEDLEMFVMFEYEQSITVKDGTPTLVQE